ncbi:tubulin polyglutamylase TTLL6 [Hetaerina americana]|uniref:tubulin polyglutamylase TTLL6 n=1 Tax=Hetaerina americana TaxID=62018 RepID=UPI003A7F52DC
MMNIFHKFVKKIRSLAICTTYCHFDVVREVAKSLGMREVVESGSWDIFWTDMSVSMERAKNMKGYQRINHFPGMSEICRKDLLARNLMRMKKSFPEDYAFFPKTWILPADYGDLSNGRSSKKGKIFILKPFLSSQGRGIFLSIGLKNIPYFERMICQRYITKPFLIDGFKFDLRVYTLVTSCVPLRVYVYNEGLARFATKKYSRPSNCNLTNVYMHLTNYALNKFSRAYIADGEFGSKRKISSLNTWLSDRGFDVTSIWNKIDDVIIKTLLSAHQTLKHNYSVCFSSRKLHQACFELLGFDIILDHKLQPFLLEVNHSPSFGTKSEVDKEVKTNLILDTFQILNINKMEKKKIIREEKQRCKGRLLQGIRNRLDTHEEMSRREQRLQDQKKWEKEHMGNFRMIYPMENSLKYDEFIKDDVSIFQPTIATRTYEEAVRRSRTEIEVKGKLGAEKIKNVNMKDKKEQNKKIINDNPGKHNLENKVKTSSAATERTKTSKLEVSQICESGDYHTEENYVRNSFKPQVMETELEKKARLLSQQAREKMIKNTDLVAQIYFSLKRQNLLSNEDKRKYGHLKEK